MGSYEIQPDSPQTPKIVLNGRTTFYVKFIAQSGENVCHYYECDTVDDTEINAVLQKVANNYDAFIRGEEF